MDIERILKSDANYSHVWVIISMAFPRWTPSLTIPNVNIIHKSFHLGHEIQGSVGKSLSEMCEKLQGETEAHWGLRKMMKKERRRASQPIMWPWRQASRFFEVLSTTKERRLLDFGPINLSPSLAVEFLRLKNIRLLRSNFETRHTRCETRDESKIHWKVALTVQRREPRSDNHNA